MGEQGTVTVDLASDLQAGISTLNDLVDANSYDDQVAEVTAAALALVVAANRCLDVAEPDALFDDAWKKLQEWIAKAIEAVVKAAEWLRTHGNMSFRIGCTGPVLSVSFTVALSDKGS
jgi:hypothetical protein